MKALIKVGVVLNLLIGLGHLLCMAALDKISLFTASVTLWIR